MKTSDERPRWRKPYRAYALPKKPKGITWRQWLELNHVPYHSGQLTDAAVRAAARSFEGTVPIEGYLRRHPRESAIGFAGLVSYARQGRRRSLRRVAEEIDRSTRLVEYWSARWCWVARVARWEEAGCPDFDAEIEQMPLDAEANLVPQYGSLDLDAHARYADPDDRDDPERWAHPWLWAYRLTPGSEQAPPDARHAPPESSPTSNTAPDASGRPGASQKPNPWLDAFDMVKCQCGQTYSKRLPACPRCGHVTQR